MNLIYIACGGAIGALLRYAVSGLPHRYFESIFPWGTLAVNVIGAFLIGFLWGISERAPFAPNARAFIFIGLLGAFTTFSTYSMESLNLLRDGEMKLAAANILISNFACIVLCFAGFMASKYLLNAIK